MGVCAHACVFYIYIYIYIYIYKEKRAKSESKHNFYLRANSYTFWLYLAIISLRHVTDLHTDKVVSVEITNKMQPCNRIYYSTVHRRLSMFRAAYRSPAGALTVFAASGLHTHVLTGRSQV